MRRDIFQTLLIPESIKLGDEEETDLRDIARDNYSTFATEHHVKAG